MSKLTFLRFIPIFIGATILSGCSSKMEPPTEIGQPLAVQQIEAISDSSSLAGKRIAIDGFPAFCGMSLRYRLGQAVDMEIHTAPDCKGQYLADAKMLLSSDGIQIWGAKSRNKILVENPFTNQTLRFLTDTYQTVPSSHKLRISGVVTNMSKNGGKLKLDAVSFIEAPAT